VTKGKAKAELAKSKTPLEQPKKKDNLVGKINTLVTVDVDRIVEVERFLDGLSTRSSGTHNLDDFPLRRSRVEVMSCLLFGM
jgi:hypothetical protein